MKTGYRLAAPIALYNYRTDRIANFFPGQGMAQGAWNGIRGGIGKAGQYIDDTAQGIGRSYAQGIQGAADNVAASTVRPIPMQQGFWNNAANDVGNNLSLTRMANAKKYGVTARRLAGYGTLGAGAAAVGGAGYLGYNALQNQ